MSDTTPHGGAVARTDRGPALEEGLAGAPAPADPDEIADREEDTEAPEIDLEAPEADAQEQHREVRRHRDEPEAASAGFDADPADATEQRRVVDLDEDDYR
ncbi:hypothetical protein [Streptacidiphilus sp. ASG 303]|uniref:hypothetical protein n=1 Tax=Streptomycetaceae TaxID=2062 RepID=UPI0027E1A46A|nr:hypothetical protein [Streptacidiphilus sp. ASG 303]